LIKTAYQRGVYTQKVSINQQKKGMVSTDKTERGVGQWALGRISAKKGVVWWETE